MQGNRPPGERAAGKRWGINDIVEARGERMVYSNYAKRWTPRVPTSKESSRVGSEKDPSHAEPSRRAVPPAQSGKIVGQLLEGAQGKRGKPDVERGG